MVEKVIVVIPTSMEDIDLAQKAALVHKIRAGMECEVHIAIDHDKEGWVAMHNKLFKATKNECYVYSCADYIPGRNYLVRAFRLLEGSDVGLVGFNDGKWDGQIATVGIVKRSWAKENYEGDLFFPGYKYHYGDTELTNYAIVNEQYAYCPNAILMEIDYNKEVKQVNVQDRKKYNERKVKMTDMTKEEKV